MALPFALVVPGQPIITNFECTNGIFHIDVENPKKIANICLFLTDRIPENYVIAIYFSLPPYNEMQYIGAIANEKPSDHFSTGFPFMTELNHCYSVKLCIQPHTYEEIAGLVRCTDGQKEYAKLVAHNLYNFMMSYHTECTVANNFNGKEYFAVPTDAFTKWMKKFDEKYEKDPNFILKTSVE